MGRTRGSANARGGRGGNTRGGRGRNAKGGKSLDSGKSRPAKQIISMTKHVTKPVFCLGDSVNGNSLSDDGATSHGPADCRVYGVKAYKPVGRNPSHPTVHIDPNNHLSYKMNVGEIKGCGSNRLCSHWYKHLPRPVQDRIVHAGFGVFILCLIGSTLCAGRTNTVNLYYLPCLKNIDEIRAFNWGGAGLSCLYRNMDSLSRAKSGSIGGYWRAWELWACEYLMPLALFRPLHGPDMWPRATRWFGAPDIRECPHSLEDFRVTLRYLTADKVVTNPWGTDTSKVPDYVKNSIATTQRRILLQGPAGYAWYLGERVSIQSLGTVQQRVPVLPPRTMLPDYRLDKTDINYALRGWEASTCLMDEDSDYATYRREYLVYRHQPIEAFKEDSRRGSVPITNIKPIEVSTISMPQRMINVVGRESGQCDMIEIPKGKKTNLLPLPSEVTCVDAKQVSELLDIIAGQNSIIFNLCMDANKEFRVKRALEEKYEKLVRHTTSGMHEGGDLGEPASRPTLQSSPTIHVIDKPVDHHKISPLGEEFFCYESDEDDNDDDGMYTDGDDVNADGEKDDRVEDVNGYDDGDKDDGVTDVDANGDGEDGENGLHLAAETNIVPPNEETNDSGKVINTSDVVIPNRGKRARKSPIKAIQPPLNKRRRAG